MKGKKPAYDLTTIRWYAAVAGYAEKRSPAPVRTSSKE